MSRFSVTGKLFGADPVLELTVENGLFSEIRELAPAPDGDYPCLAPGLMDIQINGYNGVDFNQEPPLTAEAYRKAADALWAEGCTSFMPTIITNSPEIIERRFRELAAILDTDHQLAAATPGFHLEGPFISPHDGARGAHAREFVTAPDLDLFMRWYEASGGRIKIVTVSPEWEGAAEFIRALVSLGIIVSIGHALASPEQIREAVRSGARLVTHFGNGVPGQVKRHPNFLWEELAADELSLSLICDGFHLPAAVLKTAFRVKENSSIIISDSTNFGGLPPGDYATHIGGRVTLSENGRLFISDSPETLAGSAKGLLFGVNHVVRQGLLSVKDAWTRASRVPAELCGLRNAGRIETGAAADIIEYERVNGTIEIKNTWLRGERVYSA